jgi:hypothetical protein
MKIDLLLKIQKILGLLSSLLLEIENSKADVQNDCYLMHQKFDTVNFENIIACFFRLKPCRKEVEHLQEKVINELTCSCIHQFVEDDIECNMEDLRVDYCILCGVEKAMVFSKCTNIDNRTL